MSLEATRPQVKKSASERDKILLAAGERLSRVPPDQFMRGLEREWSGGLWDAVRDGVVEFTEVIGRFRLVADDKPAGRAARMTALDRFEREKALDIQPAESLSFDFDAIYDGDEEPRPTPSLIKRVLPRGGLTIIGGQTQAGKTILALHLAVCLAAVIPFIGHPVREQSAVLYAASEGSPTLNPRLLAAKVSLGVRDRLPIKMARRFRVPADLQQQQPYFEALGREIDELRERTQIRHVTLFIDTAAAAFPMGDENAAAEISFLSNTCRTIAEHFDVLVILIHHYGKDQSRGLRGSSAWEANADHVFGLLTEQDESGDTCDRRLRIDKNRLSGGKQGVLTHFAVQDCVVGKDEDGEDWVEGAIVPKDAPQADVKAKGKKLRPASSANIAFDAAWNECAIAADGKRRTAYGVNGPSVPRVSLDDVESEFRRRYPVNGKTKKNRDDALRNAWERAYEAAFSFRDYATENVGDITYIWALRGGGIP